MKQFFPDSLYSIENISFSTFLYFEKDPIEIPLHPGISMPLGGFDAPEFISYISQRKPWWRNHYVTIYNQWIQGTIAVDQTIKLLAPLKEIGRFSLFLMSYSRTEEALEKTASFLKSTGIDYETLLGMIDVDQAFQEVMSHLCFEVFLGLYGSRQNITDYSPRKVDFTLLYNYCDKFFTKYTIEEALVNCYFFRFYHAGQIDSMLLSNSRLIPLFDALPNLLHNTTKVQKPSYNEQIDMVAWEIFRHILSPYLDKIDPELRAEVTAELIVNESENITRLRKKCWKLAEDFKGEKSLDSLVDNIAKYVSVHVESDIKSLLKHKTFQPIRDKIFADPKSWIALSASIAAIYSNQPIITMGVSVGLLSSLVAKGFQTSQENKKAVSQSDYALIHKIEKP